jgi:flagellar biogenesis protein FliO
MLHWLVEKILAVVNFVPALFVEQDSPRFEIVRGLFGLMFVLLVLIVFAWWQKRSNSKVSPRRNGNTRLNPH